MKTEIKWKAGGAWGSDFISIVGTNMYIVKFLHRHKKEVVSGSLIRERWKKVECYTPWAMNLPERPKDWAHRIAEKAIDLFRDGEDIETIADLIRNEPPF